MSGAAARGGEGPAGEVAAGEGETYMMPVEVCECRYPILVERYALAVSGRGSGKHRGGYGIVKEYRLLCGGGFVTATFGRHRFQPWGAAGGEDGSPNGVAVVRDGEIVLWKEKLARYPLKRGDIVRLVTGTGGGLGCPSDRDPALVREDVRNGFCPPGRAREAYGVELDPPGG